MFILGKNINFDFEADKNALIWYHSCGAWLNGEYYILTGLHPDESEFGPIIRTVQELELWTRYHCKSSTSKVKSMNAH